jgi:hypothetical protein
MVKKFKELLVQISTFPMQQQKDFLIEAFEKWKGETKQVDDVCVIGVKIN